MGEGKNEKGIILKWGYLDFRFFVIVVDGGIIYYFCLDRFWCFFGL